jgi:energy-coupling factor transporter ATP-binding protein EcfA2
MATLAELAPQKGKRALIIGGTRSGKSTLMDHFMRHAVETRPNCQILLLDTKPRFRAEVERCGPQNRIVRDAKKHYVDWEPGPTIPGSYRVDIHSTEPLQRYWRNDDPCRVAIAQTEEDSERPRLLEIANNWYKLRAKSADRILAVDELLDFYHRNSLSVNPRNDAPLKVSRAGGERGFGALYGAQRPKRYPTTNIRRIVRSLPVSFEIRIRREISVGNGDAPLPSTTGSG